MQCYSVALHKRLVSAPVHAGLGNVPTIPKWHVIMMYLLGAILTLLSLYVTGHTQ